MHERLAVSMEVFFEDLALEIVKTKADDGSS